MEPIELDQSEPKSIKLTQAQKEQITSVKERLETKGVVLVGGPWQSGKTTVAEAAATLVEPDSEKRAYITLQMVNSPENVRRYIENTIEPNKPTIAVVDEIAPNKFEPANAMLDYLSEKDIKIVGILASDEKVFKSTEAKAQYTSLAKEKGYVQLQKFLEGSEVIILPKPIPDDEAQNRMRFMARSSDELEQLMKN